MRMIIALMLLFFIDIIVETGFRVNASIGFGVSVKNLLLYPLFLLAIIRWYTEPAIYSDKKFNGLLVFFFVFIFYSALSLAFPMLMSLTHYEVRQGALSLKAGLIDPLLCFIVFWFFTKGHLVNADRPLKILILLVGAFCFLLILESVVPAIDVFGHDETTPDRLNGPFGEPNQTAAVLSFCLPMAISLIFIRGKTRVIYAVTAVCMLMSIVITGSRGGIVGAGLGCLYLLWAIRRHLALSNKILMIATVPILAIVAWFILPEISRELILGRFSFVSDDEIDWYEGSSGRTFIWDWGLQLWKQSPIFGQGWNGFQIISGGAPHSLYLDYIVALGIFGLSIALTFYWRLFMFYRSAAKLLRDRDATLLMTGVSAGLIALLTSLAFVDLYKPWLIVWCMLGAASGCSSGLKSMDRIRVVRSHT